MQPPVLANEFEGTITFVGSPSTAAVAQFFSAPRNIVVRPFLRLPGIMLALHRTLASHSTLHSSWNLAHPECSGVCIAAD